MSNSRNHIGICYNVDSRENINYKHNHELEAFKPLDTREEFDQSQVHSGYNETAENIHEAGVRMNRFLKGGFRDFINQKIRDFKQNTLEKYKTMDSFRGMSDDDILNRYVDCEEQKFFNPKNRVFYQDEFNPALSPKGSNERIFGRATGAKAS